MTVNGYDVDKDFNEYQRLLTRLHAAAKPTDLIVAAERITTYVQQPYTNPVYAETLVNLLMSHALEGFERLVLDDGATTHDLMTVRMVTRHVNTTVRVWRRTMDHNATAAPEG